MTIQNLSRADSIIRELKERLDQRIAGSSTIDTSRQAKDSNGFPVVFLSDGANEAAGQPVIAVRVKQIDAVSKDVFGNSMNAYSPHVAQLAYELDGSEAEPSRKDIEKVMFELCRFGIRIEVLEIADGTAVTAANMDAATAAQTLDDLYWPLKGA